MKSVIDWFPLVFFVTSMPLYLMEVHHHLPKAVNVSWGLIFGFFAIRSAVLESRRADERIYQRGYEDGSKSKSSEEGAMTNGG